MKPLKLILFLFISLCLFGASVFAEPNSLPLVNDQAVITINKPVKEPPSLVKEPVSPLTPGPPVGRLWNLQDADILSVINEVSQETGKNFIVDPRVNGKITLVSSRPLQQKEIYQVFLSVLSMLGYSAIPSGEAVKIVPNMESGEQETNVATKENPGRGDQVLVRVIPLQNTSATQLIPILRPMLPQWSNIAAYTPGNVLILLGRASNLKRIVKVIQEVDEATQNGIQIISLHYATASQVANVLINLQNAARASGDSPPISIAVDDRSNSILLGGPKALCVRIRVLIAQLDAPQAEGAGNTEVIYLRYLQAKTFAPLLGKIAQNIMGKEHRVPDYPAYSPGASAGRSPSSNTSNQSNIQAEPSTNAIIITAPPSLMRALKSVISKLDIRPAEVLVEAIIAEIDESNLTSLGIQWGSVSGNGTVQMSSGSQVTSFPSLGAGIVGLIPHVQIRAVLSVLRNQNGVDILSTPSIMVLDNQKATIEIGQDVPYQTGSYATTGNSTTATPFTTNQYKPVTLKLDVTPQINLSQAVRLKLNLKNDTLQNPQNPGLTPIINTSKISNSVIINSDDVLVLGGLISNSNNENINKVPILGDIPLLGQLFQQKTSSQQKKNLMVFIKPIIVHNMEDAMMVTHEKYQSIRSIQANFKEQLLNIGNDHLSTALPPWKNQKDLPQPFGSS